MGRYGTKTAASKAPPVQNNGVLDHFVGRNGALVAVLRVRQTGVGQVVTPVEFPLCNRRVGRIYDHYLFLPSLGESCGIQTVRFLFDVFEIGGIFELVVQTSFVTVQLYGGPLFMGGQGLSGRLHHHGLRQGGQRRKGHPAPEQTHQFAQGLFAQDRKSTRLNSSHVRISYAVFCLKKKKKNTSKTRVTNT